MYITERKSHQRKAVSVSRLGDEDFKGLTVKRYSFNWKKLKGVSDLFKLTLLDNKEIRGLMAVDHYPDEKRLEIKLLAVSAENKGPEKQYERIAGCLIAYACREAVKNYSSYPCVSLIPKTELKQHYIENTTCLMQAGLCIWKMSR